MTGCKIWGRISTMRLSVFLTALIMLTFFSLSVAACAEEITYTGDGKKLRSGPLWFDAENTAGIFPGTKAMPLSSGNKVTINYDPEAQGVQHPGFVAGGLSETENAAGNAVIISGGSVGNNVYGGWGDIEGNTAAKNKVVISGGSVSGNVYGGWGDSGSFANIVTISGGSIGGSVQGGNSYCGLVEDNRIIISGGFIEDGVCGGRGEATEVTNNVVTISGGSVSGNVYGGFSQDGGVATGNTVNISGRPNLAKAHIWGGHTECAESTDTNVFSGNSLNLKSAGISAEGVGNFEYYNFYLPESAAVGGVMLTVKKTVNLARTTVIISQQGNTKLRIGDKIALIHSAAGVKNAPKNKSCQVKQGGLLYEFSIYTDKNNLWAEVTKISPAAK